MVFLVELIESVLSQKLDYCCKQQLLFAYRLLILVRSEILLAPYNSTILL
jgi:hypothetical protein